MNKKIVKVINYIIEAGILLIVFFVPLYFSFFYQSFSLFSLERSVFFQILVEIMVFVFLLKIALSRRVFIFCKKRYLFFPFLFFLGLTLATIFSVDPHKSFWGEYMRQQGLLVYIHYFLFFIILVTYLKDKKKINLIINSILLSSFIISIYGVLQWFGFEFIDWMKSSAPFGRSISTLGQPVFLGNYLLLTIFLIIYKIIDSKKFVSRFYFIQLFIFQFFCLIFTYSRGAWLGFLFGAFFGVIFYSYIKKKSLLKMAIIFLFAVVVFSSIFIFFEDNNNFTSRIKSFTDLKSGSVAMRLEMWNASLMAISESPLLGYGPETHHEILAQYYNPNWSVYEDINTSTDRAHNLILDLLLKGGMVLLVVFTILLLFIITKGLLYLKKSKTKNDLLFFLIIGVVSYHFSLLFSFSIVETNIVFWLYVAIIFVLISDFKRFLIIDFNNSKRSYYYIFLLSSFVLCGFLIYFLMYSANSLRADYYFKKARANYYAKNYSEMFGDYMMALNLNNKEAFYRWFYLSDITDTLSMVNSNEYTEQVLIYTKDILKLDERDNNDFPTLFIKGKIFSALGKYEDVSYYSDGEEFYEKLINLNPFFPDSYRNWGQLNYLLGDYNKAIVIFKEGLSVLPDMNSPYLNNDHRKKINNFRIDIYEKLAACYVNLSNPDQQMEYYNKIVLLDPYRLDIYKKMANISYIQGDLDKAIWYNGRGHMLSPSEYSWPLAMALLYEEQNDRMKALEYAKISLKLAPDNKEIQELINKWR